MAPTPQTPGIVAGRLDAASHAAQFSANAPPQTRSPLTRISRWNG